ncbi:MAG: RDD family protein [Bacteriovoracales bacterium]|nr:RDD family protein [Bacteriovoracales bacterium]
METTDSNKTPPITGPNKNRDFLALLEEDRAEFHFRPLTSGLGFEKLDEKKEELIKRKALQRQYQAKKAKPLKIMASMAPSRGELAPFYDDRAPHPIPKMTEAPQTQTQIKSQVKISRPDTQREESNNNFLKKAPLGSRLLAYLIDIGVIVSVIALIFIPIPFALDMKMKELFWPTVFKNFHFHLGAIFIIKYFFYFTFMDSTKSSSIGKSLMKIKVFHSSGKKADIIQIFFRSFLSFFDPLFLGLSCVYNLKEDLSETQAFIRTSKAPIAQNNQQNRYSQSIDDE